MKTYRTKILPTLNVDQGNVKGRFPVSRNSPGNRKPAPSSSSRLSSALRGLSVPSQLLPNLPDIEKKSEKLIPMTIPNIHEPREAGEAWIAWEAGGGWEGSSGEAFHCF